MFCVLCFVFVVVLLFCSCCCLLFFVWTHFIVGHGTFLRHSFIIWNVVGYRQATLVMLAWLPGCSTGPAPLSGSPTLPCVLLAIMPKIWLTSRLLLFIMIHFARFYGCPVPNAVAQWSLQVNEPSISTPDLQKVKPYFISLDLSLIRHSCGPKKYAVLFILTYKFLTCFTSFSEIFARSWGRSSAGIEAAIELVEFKVLI